MSTPNEKTLKRLLAKHVAGHPACVRRDALREAKAYAEARSLAFPEWAAIALRDAAREILAGALAFERKEGMFV